MLSILFGNEAFSRDVPFSAFFVQILPLVTMRPGLMTNYCHLLINTTSKLYIQMETQINTYVQHADSPAKEIWSILFRFFEKYNFLQVFRV